MRPIPNLPVHPPYRLACQRGKKALHYTASPSKATDLPPAKQRTAEKASGEEEEEEEDETAKQKAALFFPSSPFLLSITFIRRFVRTDVVPKRRKKKTWGR